MSAMLMLKQKEVKLLPDYSFYLTKTSSFIHSFLQILHTKVGNPVRVMGELTYISLHDGGINSCFRLNAEVALIG